MAIQEVRVMNKLDFPDTIGEALLYDIHHTLGITDISRVRTAKVYRFQGISEDEAANIANRLLAEDIFQQFSINNDNLLQGQLVVEVAYKPGVMNPEAASLMKSASDLGITGIKAADSSREYAFFGPGVSKDSIDQVLKKLLVNETIERVVTVKPETLILEGKLGVTEIIPIRGMSDQELMELSKDTLFLNLEEMNTIKKYFIEIDRDPTDCEVETLAQTWSEHCGHKTFRAKLLVNGEIKTPLLKRLQQSTKEANHPLVLSAFVDNSGVMAFYDGWAICGKVETHNSPSAIEPYGGAMTGSGGVFRDIMGTGLGARVIASTDMFCFAPPWMDPDQIPPGCLHPKYMLRRVVSGVRDYGNRMGIPTNNGSVHFHPDFRAKPTVIVGAYGLLPEASCKKGSPKTGDLAVVMGGKTGRDGIHGATFSSGEMTHRTIEVNANAVQIGNAIEEKRTADALLEATEAGLIRALTDCGAGGFGSAFGEMGSETGVEIWLDKAPLKYQGLNPWEIWLSESQERMALAIDPEDWIKFNDICTMYNVEAVVAGKFTDDKMLRVTFDGQIVCLLDMEFLHNGLPDKNLTASWVLPQGAEAMPDSPLDWVEAYCQIMADPDVCSKEPIVRMYDHGVQGSSSLPPFTGVMSDGPNDATVITPIYGKNYGVVISHGMNPGLNNINPYHGSIWAATEAVSNAVAVGADPSELCLIDNFIWPFPDEESLGALDMSVDACVDFVKEFGMPFISGKDSLSSTYRGADGTVIKIPPVLCISAFGRIKDVTKTISTDMKKAGSAIVLVGQRNTSEMAGSVYCNILGIKGTNLPEINLEILNKVFQALHKAIVKGKLLSCHDISEGGIASALAEMCIGGNMGVEVNLPDFENPQNFLFNETAGTFIVEIESESMLPELFKGIPYQVIGKTIAERTIGVNLENRELFKVEIDRLKEAWKAPMKEVFGP
ncbi:MAG: phosphoribosylformylglycinamidine synthase subunit PurL [Peptococcaceae bacterium]|nr:phosphoribosylformylglycinamidine synthase subunit PurL [Peptococcaceae bacterium]